MAHSIPMTSETPIYRVFLAPDAALEVEDSGNVVLATPERRITITNVQEWVHQLTISRTTAQTVV